MLKLASNLSLPKDAVTQKFAWLGRTGSGKTYGASKLAEEMIDAGAQVVILDCVGVWYGLRLASDGKQPGISIPVFGGLHGDIPLEWTGGTLVADLIVDRGISVVLDVSQFEHDSQKARFGQEWADRFFFRKKAAPSAIHVFIEECQEFVPQNPQKGEERMLHAFQRIEKLGRNFGIGVSLISQRPQEVNKKALNQTECLFAFQMTGPQERKAIEQWVAEKGVNEDIGELLPRLQVGHAHVWSPQWLRTSKEVHIDPKRTFNASSTPEVGRRATVRELAPIDMDQLRTSMAATIEKAKAEDPRELRRQLAEARAKIAQIEKAKPVAAVAPDPDRLKREFERGAMSVKAALATEMLKYERAFRKCVLAADGALETALAAIKKGITELEGVKAPPVMPNLAGIIEEVKRAPSVAIQAPPVSRIPPRQVVIPRAPREAAESNGHLPPGERAVLIAAGQFGDVERGQLMVLTGYKRSSRDAYIARLQARGYVAVNGQTIAVTAEGLAALGSDYEPLPTGDALQEYWFARLPEGERKILEILVKHAGKPVAREDLDERTGYKRSSRDAYLSRLAARRLVVSECRGQVRASERLFS
jgi:hypothetical protein